MTWSDVKEYDPQTNELKALLTAQSQWQANKRKCSSEIDRGAIDQSMNRYVILLCTYFAYTTTKEIRVVPSGKMKASPIFPVTF